jgi:glycosyltransferase involved in cell wall biosynthesis
MAKLRLAVFNTQPPHLYYGGVERRIIETAMRLQNEVATTVYSGTKSGFKNKTSLNGVDLIPCRSTDIVFPLDNWTFNRNLSKKAKTIDADILEAHAVSGYGFPKKLKQLGIAKPFIHTIHGVLADEYEQARMSGHRTLREKIANHFMRYLADLEKETAKKAALIVTISKYSLEKLQTHYSVDGSKVRIIPNGVDTEKYKPIDNTLNARRRFGLGDGPYVLFVGSLIPRKGVHFLVEAAKNVTRTHVNTKFVIVGDGPLKKQLQQKVLSSNLLGNFIFLSRVAEEVLPALYNCAEVFVLPSIQEGQGIVLLEAQSCGKPVVAFDIGGVNEAVSNGETGLLVERGNSKALAEALLNLLGDQALRGRMGLAARSFIAENYTWNLCAQRMLNVYKEALEA